VSIEVQRKSVEEGATTVEVAVSMVTNDAGVAGVQNDIIFDPTLVDLEKASSCTINPDIGDRLPACDEDPQEAPCKSLQRNLADCPDAAGCPEGSEGLRRFRGIILSTANVNTIPDGVLYTCEFMVTGTTGTAVLQNLNVGSSDSTGTALDTIGCDGSVRIGGGQVETPTVPAESPTPTETPTIGEPTDTPTEVPPTATQPPAPTNTSPPIQPTPVPTWVDDDGCQIVAPGQTGTGWLLLIPLVGLLWLRRRSR